MAGVPWITEDETSWRKVTMGGQDLPGEAAIEGLPKEQVWDVAPQPGTDGARETPKGYQPATFQIVLTI